DPLSPSALLSGPSLYETGKVCVSPDTAPAPAPTPVPQELQWAGNGEKSIKPVAADIADAPPPRPPEGVIAPARLDREIAGYFEALDNCRVDVARAKQVAVGKVTADQLWLRWTIEPSGETGPTEVVATTPVDLDVMDCVKSAMSRGTPAPTGFSTFRSRSFPAPGSGRVIDRSLVMSSVGGTTTVTEAASAASVDSHQAALVWLFPRAIGPADLGAGGARELSIGRDETSAVCLSGNDVSRRHAVLRIAADGGARIADLGSRNGVRVNGRPVSESAIGVGDVVRLGGWIGLVTATPGAFSEIAPGLWGGAALQTALAPLRQA